MQSGVVNSQILSTQMTRSSNHKFKSGDSVLRQKNTDLQLLCKEGLPPTRTNHFTKSCGNYKARSGESLWNWNTESGKWIIYCGKEAASRAATIYDCGFRCTPLEYDTFYGYLSVWLVGWLAALDTLVDLNSNFSLQSVACGRGFHFWININRLDSKTRRVLTQ